MRQLLAIAFCLLVSTTISAQIDSTSTFWKPSPRNYQVKHAIEIEALPFVYLSSGYHISVGYRYKKFRFRASTIDVGTFNQETQNDAFERFESKGSFGLFAGYNVWKNLETYVFLDNQKFDITQKSTSETRIKNYLTPGLGISYQLFIGRYFYLQPGVHLYVRSNNTTQFSDGSVYSLPTEIVPVIRIGVRPWKKF
jgi:hypothetical protein